jgi:nicotinamidase-related amidase
VLFTALAACDLGFVVTTIADACADNKPGVHDMLVSQVLNNRGWVMTAEEFMTGVGKAK